MSSLLVRIPLAPSFSPTRAAIALRWLSFASRSNMSNTTLDRTKQLQALQGMFIRLGQTAANVGNDSPEDTEYVYKLVDAAKLIRRRMDALQGVKPF